MILDIIISYYFGKKNIRNIRFSMNFQIINNMFISIRIKPVLTKPVKGSRILEQLVIVVCL